MKKHRPFTALERSELLRLCFNGRSGTLSAAGQDRCAALFQINPDEYGELHREARDEADKVVMMTVPEPVHAIDCDMDEDCMCGVVR
jgi:hypothetical protein